MSAKVISIADSTVGAGAGVVGLRPGVRRWRIWIWRVIGALLVAVVGVVGIAWINRVEWAAWGIVSAPNRGRVISASDDPGLAELARLGVSQAFRVEVGVPRASLAVWIVEPARNSGIKPRGTILFLHGIWDRKNSQLGMARGFAERGYRGVLVDARGHGASSGEFLSYGVREVEDYRQLLDELERRGLLAGRLGVYGVSYGAGCAVQLAGADARVAAVVAVAPFSSLRSEVHAYALQVLPWAEWFGDGWVGAALERAGQIGGFDPDRADGVAAVRNSAAHFLLIHGREDAKIPWRESWRLHEAGMEKSEIIVVPGEGHDSITWDRTGVIGGESTAWFERWVGE